MEKLDLSGVLPDAADRIRPFFDEVLSCCPEKVHSLYVTGSAITSDFSPKASDVNSLIVLADLHFDFFKFLAPLGKKYKPKGISAPLVMTPAYISESLDVFPVEFLDLRSIHKTAWGADILKGLEINSSLLRLQCEREMKTRLIGVWNGYIASMGEAERVSHLLYRSIKGCIPIFRAIMHLLGKGPVIAKTEIISAISSATGIDKEVLLRAISLKDNPIKNKDELLLLLEQYYGSLEAIAGIVNALAQ
ncbi:MAG TPA: hypothetical protein VK448_11965 [Dissulfurispiraceae bacterium]|nr:hypothetical protein [Dissulfurispiraceae bacterium]